ncbi:hypothetical protein AURDEDRAFT_182168 [Auricularia subglabra TFB-10046 SS5]|nr:hypothetical protein AURDEDRAFT_182168 [Auricularia subglabra TFB-10046 SS5]
MASRDVWQQSGSTFRGYICAWIIDNIFEAAKRRSIFTGHGSSSRKPAILSLPAEFAREVFLHAFFNAPRQQAYLRHRRIRTIVQFHIAAVCRSWRAVALETPALWADIVLNLYDRKVLDGQLPYVRTLLQRSAGAPLDIFLYGSWRPPKQWIGDVGEGFFFLLARTASRWRTLHIDAPMSHLTPSCMTMFAYETPLLEDLLLSLKYNPYDTPFEPRKFEYLPHCPRLRRLCLQDTGPASVFPLPHADRAPMLSLEYVSLDSAWISPETIWDLLPLMPNVVDFRLSHFGIEWPQEVEAPEYRVCLPKLKALTITCPPKTLVQLWAPMLDLPGLTELGAFHLKGSAELQALLQISHARDTVTTFWFGGEDTPGCVDVPVLATLAKVRHLNLMLEMEKSLRTLCSAMEKGKLWPELQVLRVGNMRLDGDEYGGSPDADARAATRALMSFVKARSPPLKELILSLTDLPTRSMDKLCRLVSVKNELEPPDWCDL